MASSLTRAYVIPLMNPSDGTPEKLTVSLSPPDEEGANDYLICSIHNIWNRVRSHPTFSEIQIEMHSQDEVNLLPIIIGHYKIAGKGKFSKKLTLISPVVTPRVIKALNGLFKTLTQHPSIEGPYQVCIYSSQCHTWKDKLEFPEINKITGEFPQKTPPQKNQCLNLLDPSAWPPPSQGTELKILSNPQKEAKPHPPHFPISWPPRSAEYEHEWPSPNLD